jgi:urea transport system ATP-binding protein
VFSNLRFGFPKPSRDRVEQVLDLVALRDVEHETAANLSHGQTQWLELGLLIVQDPKVLLLDEPTAGMTAGETQKTARIINELKGRHTLVVVEHDMAFVREIAERITVLHLGQIIAEGDITKIETDPKVKEAYLGSGGIH